MLHIKQKPHLQLPHLGVPHPVVFGAVPHDTDELAVAIADDATTHDDTWELTEHPDTNELESYWSKVEQDIVNDPEWFTFTDDNQALG